MCMTREDNSDIYCGCIAALWMNEFSTFKIIDGEIQLNFYFNYFVGIAKYNCALICQTILVDPT